MSKSKFCVYLSKDLKENYCQRFNISENDFSVFCYAYARDNNLQEGLTDEVLNSAAFQKALNQNFGASEGHFLIEDQDAYDNAARLYEEMKEKYNMDENGNITFSEDATALFENPYNKKAIDDLLAWFRMNDNYFKDNVKVFTNSEGKLVIHVNKPLHSATAITSENVTDGNGFYSQEDVDYLSDRKISIEGEFKGSVKEALNAFKKAYREAVDKYEGKNHYSQGRETKPRRKLSSKIKNKEAYHSFISKLTDSILNKLESLGTNITIKADSSIKSAMGISIGEDGSLTLRYNPELVAMESERIDYIIAHELVHSVTSTAVNNVINGTGTATEKAFVDSIWGVITDLFNNKNFYWNFGFDIHDPANKGKYIKEFIANVMTNPDLQSRLADFKTDAKSTKTVWQRIVDAFKSLLDSFLGKDTSNTYLEQLMSTIQMHIESPSERLQKAFEEYDAFIDRQEVIRRETEAEMQSIKDKAIADGTFMKAPNGKPSNLTERQWLQVRTRAFKKWFGDWENDPQNASKVVDENGEPLVVYHGGAKGIRMFKNSSEVKSNTGSGYYIDHITKEKIPIDSDVASFFSDNKYVGKSYAQLKTIGELNRLYNKINSLFYTFTHEGKVTGISKEFFKDKQDFLDTLQETSKLVPRFSKLKTYLESILNSNKKISATLTTKEVLAIREMLVEARESLNKASNEFNLVSSEWDNIVASSKKLLEKLNTEEGISNLLKGEIPEEIAYLFKIAQKKQENRVSAGKDKIQNHEEVIIFLNHTEFLSGETYMITYDGKSLILKSTRYDSEYYHGFNPKNVSKEKLKKFLDEAYAANLNSYIDTEFENLTNKYSQQYAVFLNVKNPLIHDYEGTEQGGGYKESKKYPFGYVAARQVAKAVKEGYDGVVYKNLIDPYLANNYGIFNKIQVKSATDNIGSFSLDSNDINEFTEGNEVSPSTVKLAHDKVVRDLGGDTIAEQEVKDAVSVAKKGISFKEALAGQEAIFTEEEQDQIKQALNGKPLKVMSVSRMTDPAFFAQRIVKFLEMNSKKPFTDPTRVNVIELWTKHDGIPIQDILEACKKYKVAPMVSFSITSLGDTALEKGVLKYNDLLDRIEQLIEVGALNPVTTTIRIDPILPGFTNLDDIKTIVERSKKLGIKKFVTSLVQSYGYTEGTYKDRKVVSGINNALASENKTYDWGKYYGYITQEDIEISNKFRRKYQETYPQPDITKNRKAWIAWNNALTQAALKEGIRIVSADSLGKIHFIPKESVIDEIGNFLLEINKDPEIDLETCSFTVKGLKASACLDPLIIERVTGVDVTRPDGTYDRDTSRPECMCYGCHGDMFKMSDKCASSCAYCYAAHSDDNPLSYYNEDGTLKDTLLTQVRNATPRNQNNNISQSSQPKKVPNSLEDIIYLEDTVYEAAMKRYLNILSYNLTELKTVSKEELLKVISRVFKTKPKEVIENIFELYSSLNNLLKEKNITQKDYKVADNIFNAKEAGLTDEDIAKLEKIRQVFTIETENTKVLSYSEYKAFQYICDELFEIPEFADYDEEAQGYVIPEYFYDTIMLIEKLLGSKKVTPKNVEEIYHIINSDYPHVYSEQVNVLLDSFLDNTESVGSQAQSNTTTQPSAQQQTTDSSAYDHMYSFSAKEKQETIEALNEYNKEAGALGVAKPKEFVESIEQAPQKIALSEQYDEKQTKKYKTYAKIGSKNLYTIKRFIAARFTELINEFLTDPTSLERRFGPNFPIKDVTSYTREKLLAEPWLGIQILNKLIRSRFRLSEEKRNTTYADFPELIEIYDAIYNNWEDVMQEVIPLLMEREKFNPSINNEIEFSSALESDLLEAFLDAAENETQVPLAWQLGHRNRSSEMSLSATVRRALSTFPVLDENGNQVYDRELGIPLYEDERVIYNYLHKWLSRYNTKKEMLDVLRGMRGSSHSWISTLVDKLDSDPAFATLFFHNMRLDATNYSILKTEWDKEKKEYVTTNMIVNQSTPAKMIMDEVQDAFAEAAVSAGDRIDIIDSTLKGTASKYAQTLKDIRNNVLDSILKRSYSVDINDFKDAIKNKDQNLLKAIEDLSKVMNAFGIMVTPAMLRDTVLLDTEVAHAKDISLYKIISDLNTIGADIKSRYQKNSKAINIFVDKKNNKSYQAYKRIADLVAPVVKETLESSSYANGKSYYTFVPPSFLGQLMNTLRSESNTTVKELLEQEYNSEWFKLKNSNGEDTYAIAMLRELQNSIEEGSSIDRGALFDRKVQLSYNGEDYVKLTPTQYLTSIMKEFFYAPESQYAWYRVPILSNKPSSEFIKFKKYDVRTFSSNGPSVIDQLYDVFAQELKRARVVIDRAKNGLKPEELIKTYDIKSEKYVKEIEAVLKKLKAKEKITVADVVKDGKYIFFENGASFKFLDEFNRIIGENTNPELAQFLVDSIFNRNLNPEQIADKIPAVKKEIENIIASRVKNFNTYIESLGMSKNNITTMLLSQGVKIVNGTVDAMIEQFIANDMLMSINIIQLTTTDLAFYKDSIDFQKRFAQVHSPGLRLDADATFMYNGEEIEASDGYLRTIFVKDFKVKSAVIDALSAIFEARAKELEKTNKDAARDFRNMAKLAISQYEEINATDAQSLTCPSAYRKKLVMQGKWGSKEIAAFEAIKKGDLSAANLGVVFQPIKPFVFTKTNVASHSAEMPSGISVPNQQKNSEYLLFVANEIFRGQKNSTTLGKGNDALSLFKALSDYMESTHYKNGKYQKDGIDSIQFNSAVKVGEFGVIDLNKLDPNKPIESLKQIIDTNPNTYIRKFKVGDYAIQQEVPAHMQEHYQPMGSQVRALTLSDLIGNSYSISYYDPAEGTHKSISYSSSDTANLYQELIAANIQESVDALKKDLNLDVPSGLKDAKARERYINLRISELLLKEAEKDAKNGLDLKRSLLIDENGDFVIPLSDPIHSVRIQQLLNSILKKRINKQPVKGGPVVQVSSFGLSRDLKIVFKNKKREEIAATKKEGETDAQFMSRMAEEGLSLSHYEMMITCPSKEYEEIFLNPDGTSKDIEKVLKKYPQMKGVLDALAYRIPTEDAYSVLPARVVGFLPRAAGEAAMFPVEITAITGSDFDKFMLK